MSIWFLVLFTVMKDGSATAETRYPNTPEYNSQQACNEAGDAIMRDEQMKLGSNNGVVYFVCKEITEQDIRNALGAKKGNGA